MQRAAQRDASGSHRRCDAAGTPVPTDPDPAAEQPGTSTEPPKKQRKVSFGNLLRRKASSASSRRLARCTVTSKSRPRTPHWSTVSLPHSSFQGALRAGWRAGFNSWGKGRAGEVVARAQTTGDGSMGPLLDPRFSGRTRAAVNWHTEPVNWHGEFPELLT